MHHTDLTPPTHKASLFVIRDETSSQPYFAELQVNNQSLRMEIAMGATVSLAPESTVAPLLSTTKLKPSSIVLKTYTGEQIPVKGTLPVTVTYGGQSYRNLSLLVVQGQVHV